MIGLLIVTHETLLCDLGTRYRDEGFRQDSCGVSRGYRLTNDLCGIQSQHIARGRIDEGEYALIINAKQPIRTGFRCV